MIKKVHVVFKTHLDIGFTDLALNITEKYMNTFIPKAIELAETLEKRGGKESFVWTVGSWLIDEYRMTQEKEKVEKLDEMIKKGCIKWHGLPFTTHTELMSDHLFEFGMSMSKKLDAHFNTHTIAGKMTDVPGHTIGMVPILARNNIKYLHIGVNPASAMPDVPDIFVWKHADGSEVIVNYGKDYGDTAPIEGLEEILYIAHTGDNSGPPTAERIIEIYEKLQLEYPDAIIEASTLDKFAQAVIKIKDKLPVLTDEIGDTWIHGVGTDPYKVALFKALERLASKWVKEGWHDKDQGYDFFHKKLSLVAEHTWGLDHKTYLPDYLNYSRKSFDQQRSSNFAYKKMETSWEEQRKYLYDAIEALDESRKAEAMEILCLKEVTEEENKVCQSTELYKTISLGLFKVKINQYGAITSMIDDKNKEYIGDQMIGLFEYEVLDAEDYAYWTQHYCRDMANHSSWATADFTKKHLENVMPRIKRGKYRPYVKEIARYQTDENDILVLELGMDNDLYENYGAPQTLKVKYLFNKHRYNVQIELEVCNKPANRVPESLWFSFCPQIKNPHRLRINKMGTWVNPMEVVYNGNRNMHAINEKVQYTGNDYTLTVTSKDAVLVSVGEPTILHFNNQIADATKGIHFNLANNVWGTNFPMYWEGNMYFRFEIDLFYHNEELRR